MSGAARGRRAGVQRIGGGRPCWGGVRARRRCGVGGCKRDPALGPPDSFVVVAPRAAAGRRGGQEQVRACRSSRRSRWTIRTPRRCTSSSRSDSPARCCAPTIWPSSWCARSRSAAAATATGRAPPPREPTVLVWAARARARRRRRSGVALKGSFGGEDEHADAPGDRRRCLSRPRSRAAADAGRGARAAGRVARGGRRRRRTRAIRWWSATRGRWRWSRANGGWGRGPRARSSRTPARPRSASCSPPCARTATRWAPTARRARRASCSRDPGVTATVLYRLAQSKTRRAEDRARRGLRAVREGSRPGGHQPGGGARAVPQLPGEAAVGLGARGAGGQAARATSPTWSTPTGARCRPSGRRSSASSSSRRSAPPSRPGGVRPPAGNPGAALPELTALAAEVAAGKLSSHAALAP